MWVVLNGELNLAAIMLRVTTKRVPFVRKVKVSREKKLAYVACAVIQCDYRRLTMFLRRFLACKRFCIRLPYKLIAEDWMIASLQGS